MQRLGIRNNGRVIIGSSMISELRIELIRKAIHLFIAFVPFFASLSLSTTFFLLAGGIILYAWAELLRFSGRRVPVITRITEYAARERDGGKIILGPVTLALGAMAALFFYPEPAASLAIYALAFGDSISSIIGKLFGSVKIPFTRGKSFAGSTACFITVFFISFYLTSNMKGALFIAAAATILEAMPFRDLDNIIVPLGTGFCAYIYFLI